MNFHNHAWHRLALFFLLVLCYVLLMHTAREESNQLHLLYFSACGLSYFLIQHSSLQQILYHGILVRFLFIGVLPWLSQDFYRFVWDGLLLYNQLNPYAYTPDQLMQLEQVFNPALKIYFVGRHGHFKRRAFFKLSPHQSAGVFVCSGLVTRSSFKQCNCHATTAYRCRYWRILFREKSPCPISTPRKKNGLVFSEPACPCGVNR